MTADQPAAKRPQSDGVNLAQEGAQSTRPQVNFVGERTQNEDEEEEQDDDDDDGDISDSDDDEDEQVEEDDDTWAYLALPDGPISAADASNPLVSRIGGTPAFLPLKTLPPYPATTLCPNPACAQPMELLLQIFAPRDESPYDRCLHVWGCARRACNAPRASPSSSTEQNRPSLRVVRTLTFNPRWAAKLAKEKAKREEKERSKAQQAAASKPAPSSKNPFSLQDSSAANKSGGMLFGGDSDDDEEENEDEDDDEEDDQAERLAEELQIKATLDEYARIRAERRKAAKSDSAEDDQIWPQDDETRAYRPAQYLNTVPEPYAQAEDEKAVAAKAKASLEEGGKGGGSEGYERQLLSGITSTFERFVDRIRREPTQCLRYAWDGTPLPYARRLILGSEAANTPAQPAGSKPKKTTVLNPPPCDRCGAPRVFELQLMPNLVNILQPSTLTNASSTTSKRTTDSSQDLDEIEAAKADVGFTPSERAERARQRAVARALGRAPATSETTVTSTAKDGDTSNRGRDMVGLGWATAWIFVCSADCCRSSSSGEAGQESKETWTEEWVELEFEEI
ncbi:hypothetical protein OC845_002426 [Tilletia horrida]|nr:hypothetical protein OC845_002426 [Tilletia horrida]